MNTLLLSTSGFSPSKGFNVLIQSLKPKFGAWITLNSTIVAEQVAHLGFDFIVVDGQHGILGFAELRDCLIALTAGGCPLQIVRVSSMDEGEIGRALDAGAHGVIVPMINSAEEASTLAKATRYATSGGQRSYSPVRLGSHFKSTPLMTDKSVLALAMIETRQGLENIDAILDTEGIDGAFIGPYDLSLGLGAEIPFADSIQDQLETAIATIREAANSRGKIAGIYCGSGQDALHRAEQGFSFINICHDMTVLRDSMAQELSSVSKYEHSAASTLRQL